MLVKMLRYSLAATLCALAIPAAAHAAVVGGTSGTVTITDKNGANPTGIASPYPDDIDISGGDGPITNVTVSVTLTHENIEDVDIALVSPSGASSILMSDVCSTGNLSSRTFTFSQGSGQLPSGPGALCPAGTYGPTNNGTGDNWPAPGPGNITSANLNNFVGSSANGDWDLYAMDDAGFGAGSISSWGLTITTSTSLIVVPTLGPTLGTASPYPSTKSFPTANDQVIDDVNLTITGFNHEHPADVDMLLQGPTGETVMVMSDACGGDDIANPINWTFDDEATAQFGDGNATNCSAGSKKPSDFATPLEDMPAPAPPRPYGADLSAFDGLTGGNFRLFINDDASGDIGYIANWSLTITTRPLAATGFAATAVATAEGQTAQLTVNRTGSANLGAATVDVAVIDGETDSRDFGHALPPKLNFALGELSKTIEIPINADLEGEAAETFQVALSEATGDAKLADATSIAKVTIAPSSAPAPDNRFTVGQAVRLRNGSAEIPVTVPGPGKLTSDDVTGAKDQLKTTDAFANGAGTTVLKIKPERGTKRKLRRGKKVTLTAKITFTPTGGSAKSTEAPVVLKKKPK